MENPQRLNFHSHHTQSNKHIYSDHTEFHSCHNDTTAMQELAIWPLWFIEVLFSIGETPPEGATDTDPTSRPPLLVNPEVTF